MKDTVALQLHVDLELLQQLDEAAKKRVRDSAPRMSLVEWNRTPSGKQFWDKLYTDPELRNRSTHEVSKLQRELYHKDVPPRKGRLKLHDARVEILATALREYLEKAA